MARTKPATRSPKIRQFVSEYLVDLNATRAAVRAGYSPKTAGAQGSELLKRPDVQAVIAEEMEARAKRSEITADRVLMELGFLAFSDIGEVLSGGDGASIEVRSLKDMPASIRRCIESITERHTAAGPTLTVRLHSKVAAIKMLMDHLGMNAPQKHELAGNGGGPIETESHAVQYVVHMPDEEPEDP